MMKLWIIYKEIKLWQLTTLTLDTLHHQTP
jgi:hypothetical protein